LERKKEATVVKDFVQSFTAIKRASADARFF